MNWWRGLKAAIRFSEPLNAHTTFKIGGAAEYFIVPKDALSLRALIGIARKKRIPLRIIGAGSNILASDNGIGGVVVHLGSPYFRSISAKGNKIHAGSAVMLSQLVRFAQRRGLSGVEFLSGIPGTVGGALVMNAGIPKESIGNLVENVTIMTYNGTIKVLNKKQIKFRYRNSNLAKYIILGVSLRVSKKNRRQVQDLIRGYLAYRRLSQDESWLSAGCVFKNPQGDSAGRLIDLCGMKGEQVGGACVSSKHANFIINKGDATCADVLKLMGLIRKKVHKKFNIDLEPEIKIW